VNAFADLPREPLSDHYGFDRGTPVDRRYIDVFLRAHRAAIHGSVLEVADNAYTTRFGGDRVSRSTVVDIDTANQRATLIADLEVPGSLPSDRVRVEPGAKRLRAYLGGHLVFDTTRPLLVWEVPYYPMRVCPLTRFTLTRRAGCAARPTGRSIVRSGGA
jgi:hypothetical protein